NQVVNRAINAWVPGGAQADVILNYLHEGDILLHIPEMASSQQYFYETAFSLVSSAGMTDDRYMAALEENYDILSLFDIRGGNGVFDSFTRYNEDRKKYPAGFYSDNADFIDGYGDYNREKPANDKEDFASGEADIRTDILTDEALTRLDAFYARVIACGATPYTAYAAVNKHALIKKDEQRGTNYSDLAEDFDARLRGNIKNSVVIGNINDAFFAGNMFFNSDWHLSDGATTENTQTLIANLKKHL
ncbi:MAG: hypothetical protein K2N18_00410, partial [Clostridia bacterium]|nr:hypothetical protein [Clostridia bacterium]